MQPVPSLAPALVALQFVAFGWRINREISVGDQLRRTWIPLPDCLNLLSLVAVVTFCVVAPLCGYARATNATLSAGYALIAFHPISEAAHYRLFSGAGRSVYLQKPGGDWPWITDQEIVSVLASAIFASIAGCAAWHASSIG